MNKQRFLELLQNPTAATTEDLSGLLESAEQNPYSQPLHALIAKVASGLGQAQKDTLLKHAALYTTHRKVLKQYMAKTDFPTLPIALELPAQATEEVQAPPPEPTESAEPPKPAEPAELVAPIAPIASPPPLPQEEEAPAMPPPLPPPAEQATEAPAMPPPLPAAAPSMPPPLPVEEPAEEPEAAAVEEESSLPEAAPAVVAEIAPVVEPEETEEEAAPEEVHSPSPIAEQPGTENEEEEATPFVSSAPTQEEIAAFLHEPENLEMEQVRREIKINLDELSRNKAHFNQDMERRLGLSTAASATTADATTRHSETDAAEGDATPEATPAATPPEVAPEVPPATEAPDSADDSTAPSTEQEAPEVAPVPPITEPQPVPPAHNSNQPSTSASTTDDDEGDSEDNEGGEQLDIINKFIEVQPSLKRRFETPAIEPEEGVQHQEDLSMRGLEIGEGLISENLAKIMVKQGKYQRAIDIYNKLIWKFPEKRAYFAALIEELQNRG